MQASQGEGKRDPDGMVTLKAFAMPTAAGGS